MQSFFEWLNEFTNKWPQPVVRGGDGASLSRDDLLSKIRSRESLWKRNNKTSWIFHGLDEVAADSTPSKTFYVPHRLYERSNDSFSEGLFALLSAQNQPFAFKNGMPILKLYAPFGREAIDLVESLEKKQKDVMDYVFKQGRKLGAMSINV